MKMLIHYLPRRIIAVASVVLCGCLNVSVASAQNEATSAINFQFSGLIPGTSAGTVITDFPAPTSGTPVTGHATRAGGFQARYSYQFNKWSGVDAGLTFARYTQKYSGVLGPSSVQSRLRHATADFVLHIPDPFARIHPFTVVGVGALRFSPSNNPNNAAGAGSQTRSALIYGGGADFDISKRVGIRAEYRGAKFKAPDFYLVELHNNAQTHISEPSIGIYFRISGLRKG